MFSSKVIREEISTQSVSKLKPGIHDNCYLDKFEMDKTQTGSEYCDIHYKRPESNETIYKRVWFPKPDAPYQRDGESAQEAHQRENREFLSHVVLATDAILSGSEKDINAKTLKEFVTIAEQRTSKVRDKQPLRLKVIYDSDGIYSELPRFANYVEAQIEGVKQKLSFSKWELENRMTASTIQAPASDDAVTKEDSDDLPF